MLNADDATYKGYVYRTGGSQEGDAPIRGLIIVAKLDGEGRPAGREQVIQVEGGFRDLNAAREEAERRIRKMIDGDMPGLQV